MLSFENLKGFSFTIVVSILCTLLFTGVVVGTTTSDIPLPVVLNANEVPASGGLLYIYGINLGSDESLIKVEIVDYAINTTNECVNVTIVLANTLISCTVLHIGTGREKHIAVTVDGLAADPNTFFNRLAPKLYNTVTFYSEQSTLLISGKNFGTDAGVVSVVLDGNSFPVLSVNDSFIICSQPGGFAPPTDGLAFVVVDGQGSVANVTVVIDSSVSNAEIGNTVASSGTPDNNWFSLNQNDFAWIGFGIVSGFVAVSILVVFLVMKRRRTLYEIERSHVSTAMAFAADEVAADEVAVADVKKALPSTPPKDESIAVPVEDIDIYENNGNDDDDDDDESGYMSSSSSSESASPFTESNYFTPSGSPVPSPSAPHLPRAHAPRRLSSRAMISMTAKARASHAHDSEASAPSPPPVFPKVRHMHTRGSAFDLGGKNTRLSSFSMTPPMSRARVVHVPSSRIADAPYCVKQGAAQGVFDSPQAAVDSPQSTFDSPMRRGSVDIFQQQQLQQPQGAKLLVDSPVRRGSVDVSQRQQQQQGAKIAAGSPMGQGSPQQHQKPQQQQQGIKEDPTRFGSPLRRGSLNSPTQVASPKLMVHTDIVASPLPSRRVLTSSAPIVSQQQQ